MCCSSSPFTRNKKNSLCVMVRIDRRSLIHAANLGLATGSSTSTISSGKSVASAQGAQVLKHSISIPMLSVVS